jgi:poly(A) polymerase Pap1
MAKMKGDLSPARLGRRVIKMMQNQDLTEDDKNFIRNNPQLNQADPISDSIAQRMGPEKTKSKILERADGSKAVMYPDFKF